MLVGPSHYSFTMKMAIAVFAETLDNYNHAAHPRKSKLDNFITAGYLTSDRLLTYAVNTYDSKYTFKTRMSTTSYAFMYSF
jgi:hypothetical protein